MKYFRKAKTVRLVAFILCYLLPLTNVFQLYSEVSVSTSSVFVPEVQDPFVALVYEDIHLQSIFQSIKKIDYDNELDTAFTQMFDRLQRGDVEASFGVVAKALESAFVFLEEHHDRISEDKELQVLVDELTEYYRALSDGELVNPRAPRPGTASGIETETIDSSTQTIVIDGRLPRDVNVDRNLNIGGDITVLGDIISNGGIVLPEDLVNGTDTITVQAPASLPTSYVLTLPIDDGNSGEVLITDGAGVLSWVVAPPSGGSVLLGGNTTGAPITFGTNDNFGLSIETNNTPRVTISNAGDVTIADLAGTGDRQVVADATGQLSAVLPTGIKNKIFVVKDTPVITGKYYSDIKQAVDYANANATEPTAIVICPGIHTVSATITVTNSFVRAIIGNDPSSCILVPTVGLVGSPIFDFIVLLGLIPFQLGRLSIDGAGVAGWVTTAGSVGVRIANGGVFYLSELSIQSCYRGVEATGIALPNVQVVTIVNSFVSAAGDCNVLANNGAKLTIVSGAFTKAVNQQVRVERSSALAPTTMGSIMDVLMSNIPAGLGDGVLAKDTSSVTITGSRLEQFENVFVAEDNASLECVGNRLVDGSVTHYKQVDATASIRVSDDRVADSPASKIVIVNPSNVEFDLFDNALGEKKVGNFSTSDNPIFAVLTGNGTDDPCYGFEDDWFGGRGETFIFPEASLAGVSAAMRTVASFNKNADYAALVRGTSAHSSQPALRLQTLQTNADPSTAPLADRREWVLLKEPTTHRFKMQYFNGATFDTSLLTLDPNGNFGLGVAAPAYALQVGSGQIAVPDGSCAEPSYSFTSDDDTGMTLTAPNTLGFSTGGTCRFSIGPTGALVFPGLSPAGIVHVDGAGNLTSSLIVNADVSATAAITDTKLATISTAGKVANSATTATTANTANTIVLRDGSGNFSAGTITASLTGSVSGAASDNVLKAGDSMTGDLTMANQQQVRFREDSVNGLAEVRVQAPANLTATGGTYTLTLPPDDGTANQVLTTNGSGVLDWTSSGAGDVNQGGNAFGAAMTVGTNDNFSFDLETNGTDRIQISNTGAVTVTGLASAGVVHTDGSGLLSTSLIVNADIDPGASIADSKLATISTAGKVANSATTATSTNTANSIITRDASGDFAAGSACLETSLKLEETGAGTDLITVQAPVSIAAPYTLTLPVDDGNADQVLQTDGSGVLSWSTALVDGGTTTGATVIVGTNDAQSLQFETNSISRVEIDSGGTMRMLDQGQFCYREDSVNGTEEVCIQAPASLTASYTLTLPVDDGTANQVLQTNGSGILSWVNTGAAAGLFANGGNSFGAGATLGTNDNFSLDFETNGIDRIQISNTGTITLSGLASAGVVHTDASGNLSTSLIVNADVAAGANIADTKLATISTAGKVANSATTATSANTVNSIIARDASGNFDAGTACLETSLQLEVTGAGTDKITVQAPASIAAPYTLTLPVDDGVANQVLETNGLGVLSWVNTGAAAGMFANGGNSFGGAATLGTNDNFSLDLETNGTDRLQISNMGTITLPGLASAGVVHTDASGNLSTSLIVNADVAAGANIADTKLATISTAGKVANSATTATSANTASAIITRDASGNFSAGCATLETALKLEETGAGTDLITLQAPASIAAPYTLTLPVDDGATDQVLQTNGSGVLAWANVLADGGISTGSTVTVGTNDAQSLAFETNGATRVKIDSGGTMRMLDQGQFCYREAVGNGTDEVCIQAPAALTASYTLTLPVDDGTSNQVLQTDGSGVLSWANTGAAAGLFVDGGNSLGAAATLGTNDTFALNFETDGTTQLTLDTSGNMHFLDQGNLCLREAVGNGTNEVCIQAPAALAADYTLTLPIDDGNADQVLQTNGSGVLSWASALTDGGISTGGTVTVGTNDTQALAFETDGTSRVQIDSGGTMRMLDQGQFCYREAVGNGTDEVCLQAPAALAASYTLTLPPDDGNVGEFLRTDGSGVMTWMTPAGSGDISNGGDTFGTAITMGTNDNFDLNFETNNTTRVQIDTSGNMRVLDQGDLCLREAIANGTDEVCIQAPASLAASYTLTLPVDDGTSGEFLSTNGTGVLSWGTPVGAGDISNGGNTTGAAVTLGTNDNFGLNLETNNTTRVQVDTSGNLRVLDQGNLCLREDSGNGTNEVCIQAPASLAANYTLTLPVDDGANNQVLTTNGSGVLSWASSGNGDILDGGNTEGADITIGTNDTFGLNLETDGSDRIQISSTGGVTVTGLASAGVVHTNGSGLLSTSLIVNADIDPGASIADSKLATISTAGKVANSATTATDANTANAIIARDASGNFSAGCATLETGLKLEETGAGTGLITVQAPASIAAPYTLILPVDDGAADQVLQTNGSGVLSWASSLVDGGISTGSTVIVGTNDTQALEFETDGTSRVQIDSGGTMRMLDQGQFCYREAVGNGTDEVCIQAPAALAASYTLTLPVDDGTANQVLATNGSGVLSWANTGAAAGQFVNNGNSFGVGATLGTNDNFSLDFETNGTDRLQISNTGTITLPGLASAGVVHTDSSGNLSTSLIVNADVDAAANIADTKLATISTAGKVANSATTATSANTASAIIARDASGNFSAGCATLETGLKLEETGAGTDLITVQAPASIAAPYTLTLPVDDGATDQVLQTNGSGVLAWVSSLVDGGISTGSTVTVGTNDGQSLEFETNGTSRVEIDSGGTMRMLDQGQFCYREDSVNGTEEVCIQAPASLSASYTLTLPVDDGTANQVLQTDGSGVLSWSTAANGDILNGGQAGSLTIGTNDATTLDFETNGIDRIQIASGGTITLPGLASAGVVHTDASGNLSTSLIVNADVDAAANIADTKLATISTAGKVANSATTATSANTASAIIARDGSGNFAAGSACLETSLQLEETGAGTDKITVQAPASIAAPYTLTLPVDDGAPSQVMTTNGSGVLSWTSPTTGDIINGGQAGALTIGTNDATTLDFETNGVDRIQIASGGAITLPGLASAGVVHTNGSGLLSTSLIVNADVDAAANIADAKLATISTAGKVANSATTGTSLNIANAIVARDASGNFSAGNITLEDQGELRLREDSGSGTNRVALRAPTTLAADYTLTFPVDDGTLNQVLQTNGSGVLNWTTIAASGDISNGGNTFGAPITIGTNDNFGLNLETNNTNRLIISNTGTVTIGNLASTGVVHTNGSGDLSTSLIVNADVDAAANIADTKLATISTAGKVSNSATTGTSLNTASAIVARDGSGNFNTSNITLENQGQLRLRENTGNGTNVVNIQAPVALAADYTLTLPVDGGTANQVLQTNGSGVLNWVSSSGLPGVILNGGNTTGAAIAIGTNDNFGLNLETNNTNRLLISNAGTVTIPNLASAGVVHNSAAGLLTTSLIVNADVAAAAAIVDTKLATISTAGKVANSATTATTANTANTIVLRNASGNFNAGLITATFSGNLTGAVTGAASDNVLKAGDTMTGNLTMDNQRQLRLRELTANGINFVALQAPASLAADYTLTLPVDGGTANQVLQTNGSGVLSWVGASSIPGVILDGGNTTGAAVTVGTNDNFGVNFETNGTTKVQLDTSGNLHILNQGDLCLREAVGNGTDEVCIQAPAALAASYTLTLPVDDGVANQVLSTDGSGVLSWSSASGDINNGGNSFGTAITIGTNDAQSLNFETNGTTRLTIDSTGNVSFASNYKMSAYLSANTVAGAATATVVYDTENLDPNGSYNNGTGIYTAPLTGDYWVSAQLCVDAASTGNKIIELFKNGSVATGYSSRANVFSFASDNLTLNIVGLIHMTIGDSLRVEFTGNSSDTWLANHSSFHTHFMST